jgi:hypothetical protein
MASSLQLAKKLPTWFVSGHKFTRAESVFRINRTLALQVPGENEKAFSRKLLAMASSVKDGFFQKSSEICIVPHRWNGKEQRINAVQHATVSGQQ